MYNTIIAKVNTTTYEIWDATTNEMLVDKLTFEDAAEQCKVYQEFFGHDIVVIINDATQVIRHTDEAQEYRGAWFAYIDDVCTLDNLARC